MLVREAAILGRFPCRRDLRFRQAVEIGLRVENELPVALVGQNVLTELGGEGGKPFGDFGQALLGGLGLAAAGAHEIGVIALENAHLLRGKRERLPLCVHGGDAAEQIVVEVDLAVVAREDRRHVALDLFESVVRVRPGQIVEHRGDTAEKRAALFQRLDGVCECRCFARPGNVRDFPRDDPRAPGRKPAGSARA